MGSLWIQTKHRSSKQCRIAPLTGVNYDSKPGNQSATAGKNTTKARRAMSAIKKGAIPLKIDASGTSGIIDFITKTFSPIGGVIKLISTTITITMPNQIRLNPIASTKGTKIGTVRKIIARPSIIVPSKI